MRAIFEKAVLHFEGGDFCFPPSSASRGPLMQIYGRFAKWLEYPTPIELRTTQQRHGNRSTILLFKTSMSLLLHLQYSRGNYFI